MYPQAILVVVILFFIIGVAIAIARWLVIRKEEKAAAELADATRGGPPGNLGGTKPK